MWIPTQLDVITLSSLLSKFLPFYTSIIRTAIIKANYGSLSKQLNDMDEKSENSINIYFLIFKNR